ncbi:MAG TPA: CHAT domain-containing protein [Leptolyngbyaceae cyanobacterium]
MKLFKLFLFFIITFTLVLILAKPGLNQSGTQSNTTVPNPINTNPEPVDGKGNLGSRNRVDRKAVEQIIQQAPPQQAIQTFEELQAVEFARQLGINFYGSTTSAEQIAQDLCNLAETTGKKTALIYVISLEQELQLFLVLPNPKPCNDPATKQNKDNLLIIRQVIPEANRQNLQEIVREFRAGITDVIRRNRYQKPGQKLYQWIIEPFKVPLLANQIDTLVFCMDSGLRSLPIAALYDGEKFLIEEYSVGLIPSFSLTDIRYFPIIKTPILAMGISKSTENQSPLPAVAVEVPTLANILWQGKGFLNEESTIDKLQSLSRQESFRIIHIATHAEFKPGKLAESYIQFWNSKLRLDRLKLLSRQLGWNESPKVEMLVLSACRTAVGSEQAELGFAGLAVQAGVKTAVGSLWYASDEGSLALMTEFYNKLKNGPIKTEGLREAQLAMLKAQVRVEKGELVLSDNLRLPLPPELANSSETSFSHPYYWSGYTMIGNWN